MIYRVVVLGAVSALLLFLPIAAIVDALYQVCSLGREFSITQWRSSLWFLFVLYLMGLSACLALAATVVAAAMFALARHALPEMAGRPYSIAIAAGVIVDLAMIFAVLLTSSNLSLPSAGP